MNMYMFMYMYMYMYIHICICICICTCTYTCTSTFICVTPWNHGVNIAPGIGMFNPVSRDSPPGGCYGDPKICFYYMVL